MRFKPYTLSMRKVYILPTRQGLIFIIILMGMLAGSTNYANNLGFLLTFLLGSMTFVSMLHTHRNILAITVKPMGARPVFKGEKAVFEFKVQAGKNPRSVISFKLGNGGEISRNLKTGDDNAVHLYVTAESRGSFKPGTLWIETRYPMGLFRAWSRINVDTECTVYPKPVPGGFTASEDPTRVEGSNGKTISGTDDFEGLQVYQPGDPIHRISWKTFSRGQGLFLKQFASKGMSAVFLDWNLVRSDDVERKLSILCYGILHAHRMNMSYGIRIPGNTIKQNRGERHKHRCLKALAMFAES